jgi:hypothetical protein
MADTDAGTTPATTADTPSATNHESPDPAAGQLGDAGKRALDNERKARREAENELKALKAQMLRSEIATSTGVPADLLGDGTREELEARADALLEFRGAAGDDQPARRGHGKGRPKEMLHSGASSPHDDGADDVTQVADSILNRGL